jgi:hypothetical protein
MEYHPRPHAGNLFETNHEKSTEKHQIQYHIENTKKGLRLKKFSKEKGDECFDFTLSTSEKKALW